MYGLLAQFEALLKGTLPLPEKPEKKFLFWWKAVGDKGNIVYRVLNN